MTSPTFATLPDAEQTALGDRINSALIGHFHGETEPGVGVAAAP